MAISLTSPAGKGERLGYVIVVVFLSLFALVGVVTAVFAVRSFLDEDFGKGAFLSIFALVFGGFGIGMTAFMLEARKKARKSLELRALAPGEPWKWREDWAEGTARSSTKTTMLFAWAFSILWNLISLPLLFVLPAEILEKENYPALLGLLFPLVGVGLLVWAIRETLEWKTFGQSLFRLNSTPGVIGGVLAGTVEVPASFEPDQVFDVTLSCINRKRTGSGKNSSTTETILWQEKLESVRPLGQPAAMGSAIPVRFEIPYDCKQCDDTDPDDRILWQLGAHAAVPGVDYHGTFEVPVFRTAASRALSPGQDPGEAPPTGYQPTPGAGISFDVSPTGGSVIAVAPARPAGATAAMAAFFLVWTAVIVLMVHLGAPFFFPLIFGLFDLLFFYGLLQLAFGRTRIVIEEGNVVLDNVLAGFSFRKIIPVDEIETVRPSIGMQSGKSVFYSILIARRGGKTSTLHVAIREKHDAEWLAAEVRRRIGLQARDAIPIQ